MAPHLTDLAIVELTNEDQVFYLLVGPWLARRHVVQELGGQLWDDDDKTWWIAMRAGTLAGFAAARPKGKGVEFCSAWVRPEQRRQGIYRRLFAERLAAQQPDAELTARCSQAALPLHLEHGFTPVREAGRFTIVTRQASS